MPRWDPTVIWNGFLEIVKLSLCLSFSGSLHSTQQTYTASHGFLWSDPGPGEAHDLREAGEQEALLVLEARQGQGAGGGRLRPLGSGGIVISFRKTDQALSGKQGIVIWFQVPAAFCNRPMIRRFWYIENTLGTKSKKKLRNLRHMTKLPHPMYLIGRYGQWKVWT